MRNIARCSEMNMKIEYDERTEEILAEVVRDALQSDADNMLSLIHI